MSRLKRRFQYFIRNFFIGLDQPQRAEVSVQKTASCPFLGELEAELGRGEKCAAFSSHCGTSDVFEYKIRSCKHPTSGRHSSGSLLTYDGKLNTQIMMIQRRHSAVSVFLERHFRCISSWNDDGYNIFLTERLRAEEVNQINGPLGSTVRRQTRNSSTTDNIETQCFVSIICLCSVLVGLQYVLISNYVTGHESVSAR